MVRGPHVGQILASWISESQKSGFSKKKNNPTPRHHTSFYCLLLQESKLST